MLSLTNFSQTADPLLAVGSSGRNKACYHEFSEHTGAVTSVKFSYGASLQRAFSASLDKTVKVYDLPTKMVLKQI